MGSKSKQIKAQTERVRQFLQEDMWVSDLSEGGFCHRLWVRLVRIVYTTGRGYQRDNCGLHASALTYVTLVTLVPMLAIMFSFTKSFGMQERLFKAVGVERVEVVSEGESRIRMALDASGKPLADSLMSELPESLQEVSLQVLGYVDRTNFAALGVVGTLLLVLGVIFSISKLEICFNLIWDVKKPRSLMKKISEYLVILIAAPVFFVLVTSVNSMLMSTHVTGWLTDHIGDLSGVVVCVCKLLSFGMLYLFFAFFYSFMPYTKVTALSSLIAGLVTSVLWLITLMVYLKMQIGLSKFNTIYGTFAALPFFLAVVYANWCLVLLGGELGYAIQFHRFLRLDKALEPMPAGPCMVLGHLVMVEACRVFLEKGGSFSPQRFAMAHGVPVCQLRYAIDVLVKSKLLTQLNHLEDDVFVPGCSPNRITLASVEAAFRGTGSLEERHYLSLLPASVSSVLNAYYDSQTQELGRKSLEELVQSEAAGSQVTE